MEELTKKIKKLRETYRYTQQEVSEKLGLSLSGYRKIEYGQREPNLSILIELAKMYQVTTDYLLGLSGSSFGFSESAFDLMKARNDMLMTELQLEKFRRTEGDDSPATNFVKQQYFESKGHYGKSLYEYMLNYFYSSNPNPYEDDILKDKFPLRFSTQTDLFKGVTVNVTCADGTEISRVAYYSNAAYADTLARAEKYINKYKKHFRLTN